MKFNYSTISSREQEVLEKISQGLTTNEMATALFISPHTIVSHRKNLMSKLGATNTAHLMRIAFESRILSCNRESATIIPMDAVSTWSREMKAI